MMQLQCCLLVSGVLASLVQAKLVPQISAIGYNSESDIVNELEGLTSQCKELNLSLVGDGIDMPVATYRKGEANTRIFVLAGEHAREMVTSELGLNILRQLCDPNSDMNGPGNTLSNITIEMVLTGNPKGRRLVEEGEFCWRANENGVDLNRNWRAHWKKQSDNSETQPGPKPFSESETRLIRDRLQDMSPHMFLTIHSGDYLMFVPHAYNETKGINHDVSVRMLERLTTVQPLPPVGIASDLLHSNSYGTCLDYANDVLKIPFNFGWEIYKSPYQNENNNCFTKFNPATADDLKSTLGMWTQAFFALAGMINMARNQQQ